MEKWLDKLNKEILSTFLHLDLFKKLNEVIDKNQRLKKMDTTILIWMKKAFTVDLVIGIGRICDTDSRTESLVQFLSKLKNQSEYLTRKGHSKLYKNFNTLVLDIANETFDYLAGKGKNVYSVDKIESDISMLTTKDPCHKIINFRNQYIAHTDKMRDNYLPTYGDLFASFKTIEEIAKKYNLLIRGGDMIKFTPEVEGYCEEVFTIPWIDKT